MQDNRQNLNQNKIAAGQAQKKSKKEIGAVTIAGWALVVVMIIFLVMVYFDTAGLKQGVADFLKLEAKIEIQTDGEQQTLLEEEKAVLDQRQIGLNKKEKELSQLEDELYGIEQVLYQKIDEYENATDQAYSKEDALKAAALIFEQMDADNAAEAISKMETVQEMADLLLQMTTEKAAQIMDNIKSDLASKIASAMMS